MTGPFVLQRDHDVSGVSGTGIVAWGYVFPDGKTVLRWATQPSCVSVWDSVEDIKEIHGHEGKTRIVWS